MKQKIWDFWAKRYDRLWVQKYSLKPTRDIIINLLKEDFKNNRLVKHDSINVLDLGCGPGELINSLGERFNNLTITGADFSGEMLKVSKLRNPKAKHIQLDAKDLHLLERKFKIIICTHSLPYYKNLEKVVDDFYSLLEDDGRVYLAFASGNSFYDKLALSLVKLTTGPAYYPSDKKFKELIKGRFNVESLDIIREKRFMPRIAVYKLKKVIR